MNRSFLRIAQKLVGDPSDGKKGSWKIAKHHVRLDLTANFRSRTRNDRPSRSARVTIAASDLPKSFAISDFGTLLRNSSFKLCRSSADQTFFTFEAIAQIKHTRRGAATSHAQMAYRQGIALGRRLVAVERRSLRVPGEQPRL